MRIILDTETTGLSPVDDEILELSIIDADSGEVLHSKRYDTVLRFEWPAAEAINGISPNDVRGLPDIGSDHDIQRLLDQAEWIGGWNIDYDLSMLSAVGVLPRPDAEIVDVMQMDADLCGLITPDRMAGRWRKLAIAAEWWGYQPPEGKMYHSSIVDCLATRHVYRAMVAWRDDAKIDHVAYMYARASMRAIMEDLGHIQGRMLTRMQEGIGHDDPIMQMLDSALDTLARDAYDIEASIRGGSDANV